jgi:hypothetical protein
MKKLGAVWKEVKVVFEPHVYKSWHTLEGRKGKHDSRISSLSLKQLV